MFFDGDDAVRACDHPTNKGDQPQGTFMHSRFFPDAFRLAVFFVTALFCLSPSRSAPAAEQATSQGYSTCKSWQKVVEGGSFIYPPVTRVSDPGTKDRPAYTGFWFFDGLQFDETSRYALAMKVDFQKRDVMPSDRGEIGYIDLEDDKKWTKIGETTAWNWQQGCRLTWRGKSQEILWNDRSDDGTHFVCRAYDFRSGIRRTLPRPIYDVSRDGAFALTHDFQRMRHGGTNYVGIRDRYEGQVAPAEIGIEKMDMNDGRVELLVSLKRMNDIAFPSGYPGKTDLYFFREGWNPSGTRFIAFLKNADRPVNTSGWSISADGRDIRLFYMAPSHHAWVDEETILEGHHFSTYKDDGSGKPRHVAEVDKRVNFDTNVLPDGKWFLLDTYPLDGYQHVLLYHRTSRLFVPLAKLKTPPQWGPFTAWISMPAPAGMDVRCALTPRKKVLDGKCIRFRLATSSTIRRTTHLTDDAIGPCQKTFR